MKAVIIAAGDGTRFGNLTKKKPKPLIKLLGIPILERVILSAREAGIKEFIIVIGYLGKKIKKYLKSGERLGVKIKYVKNKEWLKGNALSVLKAKKLVKESFVLLMSDHIFDYRILKRLIKKRPRSTVMLAVDRRKPTKEDTKVFEKEGKIVRIGKNIKKANAVDTGIFLLKPKIFSYIEKCVRKNKTELSHAIALAASKGDAEVFDITEIPGNVYWCDIDTVEDLEKAEQLLCSSLTKRSDGIVAKYINRPISTRISRYLAKCNVTPNVLSLMSFSLSLLASFLFSFGRYIYSLVAGLLVQLASIIDGCDGEIARLKFERSPQGAWFDAMLDRIADALIIFGIAFGYWNVTSDASIWLVSFFALMGSFLVSYSADKYEAAFKKKPFSFSLPAGRDVRSFIIMLGAIFNQPFLTLCVLAVLTLAVSIVRIYKVFIRF